MFIREITYSYHRQIETACEPNDDDVDDDDMHFSGSGIVIGVIAIIHILCESDAQCNSLSNLWSGRELII